MDNALKRMNHFPADSTVCFVKTCALDSDVLEKDESFIAGLTPSIKFARTNLYTMFPWVVRGTVRVKCLAQEHNTMFPIRAITWAHQSRVQGTYHYGNHAFLKRMKITIFTLSVKVTALASCS